MFTKSIRKLASKLVMLSMLFTTLTPLGGLIPASAAGPLTGNLQVGFDHHLGGFTVKNGLNQVVADKDSGDCFLQGNGFFTCNMQLETGPYLVEFDDVTDYITPDNAVVNLTEVGTSVLGEYELAEGPATGSVSVGFDHIDGGFTLSNGDNVNVVKDAGDCPLQANGFFTCNFELETGPYEVTFDDVTNYITPDPVVLNLDEEGDVVQGEYILPGPLTGTLTVGFDHVDAGYTLTNGNNEVIADKDSADCELKNNGYYVCTHELETGPYLVEFKDVNGYVTPGDEVVDLDENGDIISGTYVLDQANTGDLAVGVNHVDGGFTITNGNNQEVANKTATDCVLQNNGYYTCHQQLETGPYLVEFTDVDGYITPADIVVDLDELGDTVYGFYALVPTGAVEVRVVDQNDQPILDLPENEWQLKKCANEDPNSCFETFATGGQGTFLDGLGFATYRIVFPSGDLPEGYLSRIVIPSAYQDLDSNNTYILFTIKYTDEGSEGDVAYVDVHTRSDDGLYDLKAQTRMVTLDPPQADQEAVTSVLVNNNPITYGLDTPDLYTLPISNGGVTEATDYYIECLPAPGGYHAPANPIQVTDAVYATGTTNLAGVCEYTSVPDDEKVTITIDTVGVTDAEILVDNVTVREKFDDNPVQVEITITEDHTINWTDEAGFTTPVDIFIPANTLNANMDASLLQFLGYYVPLGNLATAEVNTENQNGWVYITIGADPTKWNVGYADTTATPLIVHFDETVNHTFHFQDRNLDNPAYYLRAVPNGEPGFGINKTYFQNGNDVTYWQENYTYTGPQNLGTVQLVGDYIAESDAGFFHAKTTNADPVFGEIYVNRDGGPTETYEPGANTFTELFISDVVNDQDTTCFESPITVNAIDYTAQPECYDLSDYNPSPTIVDLISTYVPFESDVVIELVSLDPNIDPSAGLTVTMDGNVDEQTVDNNGTIEASFPAVDPSVDHDFVCPAINGLQPPNAIYVPADTLQDGENRFHCIYAPQNTGSEIQIETEAEDNVNFEAPITLTIENVNYNVGWTQNDNDPQTPATLELWIDASKATTIVYGDMPGYITPAPDVVNVAPGTTYQNNANNIFNGFYAIDGGGDEATLSFFLKELDAGQDPVTNTDVTVNAETKPSDGQGEVSFTVDVTGAINVSFADHPLGPNVFVTPNDLNFAPNELQANQTYDFIIWYVPIGDAVTLDIETLDEPTQTINVNGGIYLIVNNGPATLYGFGTAQIVVSNSNQFSYQIDWAPTVPASQYIEPLVDPLDVDVTGLNAGDTMDIDGLYRLCTNNNVCEVVDIIAYDENNAVLNSVSITVNGQLLGFGSVSVSYDAGSNLNIQFGDVVTHGVPDIEHNNVYQVTSHNTQYSVLANQQNLVEAFYPLEGDTVVFNVSTEDDKGNALTEDISHGPNGNETTEATPAAVVVDQADLNSYTINFADKPGYVKPEAVVVTNGQINSIPARVTITQNNVDYTAGTPLTLGSSYEIVGTYEPFFMIEKKIISEQTIVGNNKRVQYQITVTRHPDTQQGQMDIDLHDTISDNNRTLVGSNGGTMSVVPQNGNFSVCSNGCGDITAGTVNVIIDNPGNSVTITYETLSNNAGIPANQSSAFTNTLTGTYQDGQDVVVTTSASVSVLAPPTGGNGCPPFCGGGGGGGGGGVQVITGDMILEMTKLVSLDKINWYDASDPENALVIPKFVDTKLYTRVNVKNLGQVSATNIKYVEGFDQADSLITSDDIMNVQGDDVVSFNETTQTITISKIIVGGEVEFSYEQMIHENGANGELAEEYLLLEDFGTSLTINQDGLTKHGIGDHFPSYLIAGSTTTVVSEGSLLELSIRTDKAAASVGEEVVYTITAKNNADFDFTGLILTWGYDPDTFEILNPFGGRDTGTEIHWDHGLLRPGETVQYQVRTRIKDSAPVGDSVRTTARGLVDQLENPAVVDHYLQIIAGITVPSLAQTGLNTTLMLMIASVLAYLGYTRTGQRRYLALKAKALRPL